jgi:hypothetical protein
MQVVELAGRYDISCVSVYDKIGFIQNSETEKTCNIILHVSLQLEMLSQLFHIYLCSLPL